MITPTSPAFPHSDAPAPGLSKREYFAAAALQGMLASDRAFIGRPAELAEIAVELADALISDLNKGEAAAADADLEGRAAAEERDAKGER